MSRAFTPGLVASPAIEVVRTRELPVLGEILVKEGELVTADQVVAKAELPGELYIIRIAERIGLEPNEVISGMLVKEGDSVKAGQLICEKKALFGIFKSQFHVSQDGTIEFINENNGHVGLRLPSRQITKDAYISGQVTGVTEGKSVTILTKLCFIQGVFGVGGEKKGKLKLLPIKENEEITEKAFSSSDYGMVCVGGSSPTIDALLAAKQYGINGLICGSIDDKVLSGFLGYDIGIALTGDEQIPFSIIITEGFGKLSIAERIIKILAPLQGELVSLNGKTQVRAGAVRPEILVDISNHQEFSAMKVDKSELSLKVGAKVRIIRVPNFGQIAEVIELPKQEERIPSGATARVLRARILESEEVITVPRANVELVSA